MSSLRKLRNIGVELERKLNSIGIHSIEEFQSRDVKDTFISLKQAFPNVSIVHLYALEGALTDTNFNQLPKERLDDFRSFYDELYD